MCLKCATECRPVKERFAAAVTLHQSGEVDRAVSIYQDVVCEVPTHAGAWHLLGVALHQRGELLAALGHIRRALSYCDTKATYWNNCGAVLKDLGQWVEAKSAFQRAVCLRDNYADAWSNLGLMQTELGDLEGAEKSLRYALRLEPRHIDALRHLAVVYRDRGELDEALRLCQDAATVSPVNPAVSDIEGSILGAMKRFDEAAASYRKAVSLKPDWPNSHVNLGTTYIDMDEVSQAREAFARAAELRPDRLIWRLRHLTLCPTVFPTADAITAYRAELERELDEALAGPVALDWRGVLSDGFIPSFQLSHHGVCNRRLKEKFARLFDAAFPKDRPKLGASGRIRVGFTCTRNHEGGFVRGFGGIMKRLDPEQFEVVGLVSQAILPFCRRMVSSANVRWIGFPEHLESAFQVFTQARCDVVMHWQAGTDVMNYFLPFLPLAPVQCIGFGSHGTTGISNIDYFLSSNLFERGEEAAEDYTEELVRFEGLTAWQERPRFPSSATRAELGLPESGALYFCPQRLAKFHPAFDLLISQILQRNAEGRVVLLEGNNRGRWRH